APVKPLNFVRLSYRLHLRRSQKVWPVPDVWSTRLNVKPAPLLVSSCRARWARIGSCHETLQSFPDWPSRLARPPADADSQLPALYKSGDERASQERNARPALDT